MGNPYIAFTAAVVRDFPPTFETLTLNLRLMGKVTDGTSKDD